MSIKKGLVVLAGTATMLVGTAAASAAVGTDVKGTKYEAPVNKLTALQIVTGYEDGSIQPEKTITRAEFAAIVVRELNLGDNFAPADTNFSDVSASTHWAGGYVNVAVGQGILKGYPDGTFKPDAPVSYAEAATMLVRMLGYGPSVDENNWPASYIGKAASIGVTSGVRVSANDAALRGDVLMMAANSLEIDLMEQDEWGTEQVWREKDEENILTKYFDLDIYDDSGDFEDLLTVDNIPRVDLGGLEANELEFSQKGNNPYEVVANFDPNEFLGQDVEAWVDEDEDIVYYIAANDDQEVYFDDIYVDNGRVYLDDEDDDFAVNRDEDGDIDVDVWLNIGSMNYADFASDYDSESNDIDAKVVLDKDDKVVAIIATDYYLAANDNLSGLVSAVDADGEVIEFYDENGTEDELELEDEDYAVVKDGAQATLADIEEGDIVNVLADDNEYFIVATSTKVEGTITSVRAGNNNPDLGDFDLYIDGEKYDTVDHVTLSEDGNDSVDSPDIDDIKDLDEEEVTLYLDANGDVRHIVSGELDGNADLVGVVTDFARYSSYDDEVKFSIVNTEGNEIDFSFDPSDVDFDGREISGDAWVDELGPDSDNFEEGKLIAIEYDLNKNGELTDVELLTIEDAVVVNDSNNEIDEDDDTITFGSSTYNVTDKTVIWDVTEGIDDNEIDDVATVNWSAVEGKNRVTVAYTTDNDEVEYMFVLASDGGKLTSEGEYGVILDFSVKSGDDAIVLLNPEGEEITLIDESGSDLRNAAEGDFIRYELNSDGEIDEAQILASSEDAASMTEYQNNDDYSIDFAKDVVVQQKSATHILGTDGVNYAVGSNTVYFDISDTDELDVVRTVGKDDLVYLVDTDDDGRTVDFVVLVQEDYEGEDVVPVAGVTLNEDNLDLVVDEEFDLDATVDPANATNKEVTWSSNNEDVATVDENGNVTAIAEGEATITATAGNKSDTCEVTVTEVVGISGTYTISDVVAGISKGLEVDVNGLDEAEFFNVFANGVKIGAAPVAIDETVVGLPLLFTQIDKLQIKFFSDAEGTNVVATATLADGKLNITK